MNLYRAPENPVIEPEDIRPSRDDFEVIGVFNAGVTRLANEVILLLRIAERPISSRNDAVSTAVYDTTQAGLTLKDFPKDDPTIDFSDPRLIVTPGQTYLTSISHLRVARSEDGVNFRLDDVPAIAPENEYETFGIEDPRISLIEEMYYISYVAASALGVVTCLASTKDFNCFERHGVVFCPENKDVAILPEQIDGRYYALHRPSSPLVGGSEIWLAESPDLICWGNHRHLLGARPGLWDEAKIGSGAVPFRIEQGWIEVYHGADRNNRYCLGAVLLDSRRPWEVVARSNEPILQPQADYERRGFFGNVVFSCGLLCENDRLKIYYGAGDTSICYAELLLQDVLAGLNS